MNKHSVKNFEPSEYTVLEYLDNQPPKCLGATTEVFRAQMAQWKREITGFFPKWENLPSHDHPHNIRRCTHCGNTSVRYIVAVQHVPTGEVMVFGSSCVDHLDFANRNAFKAAQVRRRALEMKARLAIFQKREKFLEGVPALRPWADKGLDGIHADNTFAQDILRKLNQYGSLSERQVECFFQSLKRDEEREDRRRRQKEEAANAKDAPRGRHDVQAEVLSTRVYHTEFGTSLKMLVRLETPEFLGSKAWLTVPNNLAVVGELRGKRISFRASFEGPRNSDDPKFAIGKRPGNAEIIS